jgi:hypothetical protein
MGAASDFALVTTGVACSFNGGRGGVFDCAAGVGARTSAAAGCAEGGLIFCCAGIGGGGGGGACTRGGTGGIGIGSGVGTGAGGRSDIAGCAFDFSAAIISSSSS